MHENLQYIINTNVTQMAELKWFVERQQDFWEWYENTYQVTRDELWDKFEQYEFDLREEIIKNRMPM